MSSVLVVDYGLGNLTSVCRALEVSGAEVELSSDPASVALATKIVLPGVGSFSAGSDLIRRLGWFGPLLEAARQGCSVLGICLGMQLLFEAGEEFGEHPGLGLLAGRVRSMRDAIADPRTRLPHIGWTPLLAPGDSGVFKDQVLAGVPGGAEAYFVHSFFCAPKESADVAAWARYGGLDIPAVVRSGSVVGCQFHPERSGEVGLRIIKSFLQQ